MTHKQAGYIPLLSSFLQQKFSLKTPQRLELHIFNKTTRTYICEAGHLYLIVIKDVVWQSYRDFNDVKAVYSKLLLLPGLSKYIEIDSGGESGQKLNVLYKLEDGKYVSLWFTVSQAGDYLLYEKHIT